jgi:hypothetical protein
MSETQTQASTEAKAKRPATEYTKVKMDDGREVEFAGKRKMAKEIIVDEAAGNVTTRFDFRNGKTLTVSASQLTKADALYACGHGLGQKCGDNAAGVDDVEDMYLAVEDVVKQLTVDKSWSAAREAGDSTAGASIVIKAICEANGKSVDFVKEFLNKKLEAAKAAGQKLSRQELYNAFRNPATKTGQIIKRLEEEKLAKGSSVDASALLAEMA